MTVWASVGDTLDPAHGIWLCKSSIGHGRYKEFPNQLAQDFFLPDYNFLQRDSLRMPCCLVQAAMAES